MYIILGRSAGSPEALLKKTGARNLFTVFGEPDLDIESAGDEWVLTIQGVDVYDPTTGNTFGSQGVHMCRYGRVSRRSASAVWWAGRAR